MRAYVIKEQTSMADALGLRPAIARTNPGAARNTDPVANTEGARQIGIRFTRQEWESIFLYATRHLTDRQTNAEQTQRFRSFYNRFGPSSQYRTPQSYGAALSTSRVPFTTTTFSWPAILSNLQNVLRQSQQDNQGRNGRGSLSDDQIRELASNLTRATRGANWNEGEIVYNLRQLQNQNDYDRLNRAYSSLQTVNRSLEYVLTRLNDEEKRTMIRIFNERNIQPGEEFSLERDIPTQFNTYNLDISEEDFPNNVEYDRETSQQYIRLVLNTIIGRLGTDADEQGTRFYDFLQTDAPNVQDFRRALEEIASNNRTRGQLDVSIAGLIRTIWPLFEQVESQQD